ncbi:hypothetical protein CORC01_03143, partial [Colletotrichum orchidophilum]
GTYIPTLLFSLPVCLVPLSWRLFPTLVCSLNSKMETTKDVSPSKSRAILIARSGPHFDQANRNKNSHIPRAFRPSVASILYSCSAL